MMLCPYLSGLRPTSVAHVGHISANHAIKKPNRMKQLGFFKKIGSGGRIWSIINNQNTANLKPYNLMLT